MSFFKQSGQLFSTLVQLTPGTLTASVVALAADEWLDIYGVTVSTNDTALQQVSIADSTGTVLFYFVGGANVPNLLDIATIPVRVRKGSAVTVTAAAITAAKTIGIKITGLRSKT